MNESGGRKRKSGMMGFGFWRLAGWEISAVKGSNLSAHRGLKNVCFEIEKLWYGAARLFVYTY